MIAPLLVVTLGTWSLGAGNTLSAQERAPAVLFVIAAKKTSELPASGLLLESADHAFRKKSGLAVDSPERLGIDPALLTTCAVDSLLGCWVSRALDTAKPPRFVVGLTLLRLDRDRLRVSVTVLDVKEGARVRAAVEHEGDAGLLEDELAKTAWIRPAEEVDTRGSGALVDLFRRAADEARPWLEARGVKMPASVFVQKDAGVATVSLDGAVLGALEGQHGTLLDLRPGKRTLRFESAEGPIDRELVLEAGGSSTVSFVREAIVPAGPMRTSYRIGGPVLTAGGGVIAALALVIASGARSACLGRPGVTESCPTLGNATTGFDASAGPSNDPATINPAGLDLLALGFGLAGSGVVLGLFGWLGDDSVEPPWWSVALALGVGGALYATTAIAGRP